VIRATVLVAVIVMAIAGGSGAVGAQELPGGNNTTTSTPSDPSAQGEQIDKNTRLVDSSYSQETGEMTVTVHSESLQELVFSDAGAFAEGGVVEQRKLTVRPDETVTITMPATRTDRGYVGVSIATRNVLYAEPIEASANLNPWRRVPPMAGWVGGATAIALSVVVGGVWVRRRQIDEPEAME
jgi:hypothetical protein